MIQNRNPCLSLADFSNPREGVQVISRFRKASGMKGQSVSQAKVCNHTETFATHRDSHCTSLPPREEDPTLDF